MAGQEETLPVSPTAEATSHPEAIATLGEEEDSEEEPEAGNEAQGEADIPEEMSDDISAEQWALANPQPLLKGM